MHGESRKKPNRSNNESLLPETKPAGLSYPLTELDSATDGFNQRRIIGSEAPGERIVVTEFIGEATSLSDYLHGDSAVEFGWKKRFKIAAGAARGLEYLHEIANPRIVHGRFTSSNVLIDDRLTAKICDYGFGFLIPIEKSGIYGYTEEGYCKESDVYGYGVVLMEILSGRKSENGMIVKWATPLIKEQRFGEFLDPRIVVQSEMKGLVIRLAKVALACVGNSRRSRPSISEVAAILNSLEREGGWI